METTKYGQVFYRLEADREHPEGCRCTSSDAGGDCSWCQTYYRGPTIEEGCA